MVADGYTLPREPRVVLVHKQSTYEKLVENEKDPRILELLEVQDISVAKLHGAHERHKANVAHAIAAFRNARRFELVIHELPEIDALGVLDADLVVVVGGDGTALATSHHVLSSPLLALNSDPQTSVGYLCTAKASDASALVEALLEGALHTRQLSRIGMTRNGAPLGPPVLNDVLYCHDSPAATSSYLVAYGDVEEAQKSSGIWISTAAGSTAAIRSAGGVSMPLDDRSFQYRIREPYVRPGHAYHLLSGILDGNMPLRLTSKMTHSRVYLDGPHNSFDIAFGDRIEIQRSPYALRQLWFPQESLT